MSANRSRRVALPRPKVSLAAWAGALLCLLLVSVALAYPPEQAAEGAKVYTDHCSTCHGDVGQGLTDEWRSTWPEGEQNCWIPACHGGNPPKPLGFSLPRTVPALVGPGTLTKFTSAQALHAFIKAMMPMQEPGSLSDDQYWSLTAFLLQQNGVPADSQPLGASNAATLMVPRTGQPAPVPQRTPNVILERSPSMRERSMAPPVSSSATALLAAPDATAIVAQAPAGVGRGPAQVSTSEPAAGEIAQVSAGQVKASEVKAERGPGRHVFTTSLQVVLILILLAAAVALAWLFRRQHRAV